MSIRGKRKRVLKTAAAYPWRNPTPGLPPAAPLAEKDVRPGSELFKLNAESWILRTSISDAADPTDPEAHEELQRRRQDILNAYERELTKHRSGRQEGAKGKRTLMLERKFDALYHANPDLSAEEARTLKARGSLRKMPRSTFAKHWNKAEKRAK